MFIRLNMLEILKIRVSDTRIGMYTAIFGQCNILGELALLRCRCYKRVIHWLIGSWFFIFKWRYIFGVYPIFWPKFLIIVGFRSEVSFMSMNSHQCPSNFHEVPWYKLVEVPPISSTWIISAQRSSRRTRPEDVEAVCQESCQKESPKWI